MFITALFTKARKSNQPKSLQPTEIMKTWPACYVILCSRGENEIMNSASKWIELEKVTLSEVSQIQKLKGHMFFHWRVL